MSVLCQFEQQDDGTRSCLVCGLRAPKVAANPVAVCRPRTTPLLTQNKPNGGTGSVLKELLRDWLGIESTPNCSCNAMARKMDTLGPEWCKSDDGMAEILGVMRTEHAKRWADGRTILPWTDLAARQLVLLACRRAAG
jgi:hypothetical protein